MSYAQFILLRRVWDAIPGLCLIQNKAKQNRAPSQHDPWLSPALGLGKWPAQPSGCGESRGEDRNSGVFLELNLEGRQGSPLACLLRWPPNSWGVDGDQMAFFRQK